MKALALNFIRQNFLILASLSFMAGGAVSGCSAKVTSTVTYNPAIYTPTGTVYNCTYYGEFDTLNDCQYSTLANCNLDLQTVPSGAVDTCYAPVTGYEVCTSTPTDWIYTTWNVTCQNAGVYQENRSVIGCSSNICACLNAQTIQATCTDDASCEIPATTPTPVPPACP
jgi:hypothetical protein